ncbi:Molybdopterin synthase subunit MoaD / molybdopterin synthase subunit MoaE [Candidatus Sulfopaludibacter sp. SbA4]|nr:Molybdopterin synthase subunit MoaD / molybdopterin synthase subunit MoaE [Candidatus Sulfopaludibacter sp. SbA4]
MRVRVLFFGMLKDFVGRPGEECDFPDGANLAAIFDSYARRYPVLGDMARSIVMARNQEFAELSTPVQNGDEVAFLPPVSGGASTDPLSIAEDGNYFALTRHAIDSRSLIARIMTGSEGAVVTFEGTVRNNTKGRPTLCLDYECYESMALKTMAQIGREIAAAYPVGRVAMVHRLGRLLIGETSVAVIVTAPHRRPAFEAALEGINRLKKLVPIWKKEHFVDGEVWVEGEWDRDVPTARQPTAAARGRE